MHLSDCEISTREVKGHRLVILFGPHALNATEGAALLGQYGATHGGPTPIYASPSGWQVLEPVAAVVAPVVQPAPAAPSAPVAAAATKQTKFKK